MSGWWENGASENREFAVMWKVAKLKKWNMVHRFGKRVVKENY